MVKEQVELLIKELEKNENWRNVLAVGLLPAPKEDKQMEMFYKENIPEELQERFKESFERPHVLIIINDQEVKDLKDKLKLKSDIESRAIQIVRDKQLNLWIDALLVTEIYQFAMDSRFEIFDIISRAEAIFDTGFIEIIRLVTIHRTLVLKKFDRYVVSYVLGGSLVRGKATKRSDVDAYVIIDDTDVKRHTQWELKQKLLSIIWGLAAEAESVVGSKRTLHVQVYTLTEFWKALREVNPVITTFLRDGIPLYDRGTFIPWKLLLFRGEVRPSPEAVESLLRDSKTLIKLAKEDLTKVYTKNLYWAIISSAQAVVMAEGHLPPAPKEAAEVLRDLFVKDRKLLEEKYINLLEKAVKLNKELERGDKKDLTGKEIDEWISNAEEFVSRMERLKSQIEKIRDKKILNELFDESFTLTFDLLKILGVESTREELVDALQELYATGKITYKALELFKQIYNEFKKKEEGRVSEIDVTLLKKTISDYSTEIGKLIEKYLTEKVLKSKISLKVSETLWDLYLFGNILILKGPENIYELIIEGGKIKDLNVISKEEFDKKLKQYRVSTRTVLTREIVNKLKELVGGEFEIIF